MSQIHKLPETRRRLFFAEAETATGRDIAKCCGSRVGLGSTFPLELSGWYHDSVAVSNPS